MQDQELRKYTPQEELPVETHNMEENLSHQALLELLSTEPPRTVNVIEMIAKSGGHHCSSRKAPSPEMIDRVVDLSDI
jgi:hypothetical protein